MLGAARYEFWVNQVGGPVKLIYNQALQGNTFTPSTPLPNGTFDAYVRPLAADGEGSIIEAPGTRSRWTTDVAR
jgi:hypothetical protein